MKKLAFTILFMTQFVANSLIAQEVVERSFFGKWCGKWDNIYSFCLTIDSIDSNSVAKYRWLEHPDGKHKKSSKKVKRVNRNTLKIDNIWFALDEKNIEQANAMGVFQYQSRIAVLKKQKDE